jgi:hypothetical protein
METMNGFQKFFMFMGPWKWLMVLMACVVFVLTIAKFYDLIIAKKPSPRYLNAILFWGGITAVISFIARYSAYWMMVNEIMDAPDISAQIVFSGYLSSFAPPYFGFIVFLASAIVWWGLRNVYHNMINRIPE